MRALERWSSEAMEPSGSGCKRVAAIEQGELVEAVAALVVEPVVAIGP
jgi:hypothetical protein